MKISYLHPQTQKRTSITINDRILRLWAITEDIDVTTDDFLYSDNVIAYLKGYISDTHNDYLEGSNNFPTFVSYFENTVFIDVELLLLNKNC